MLNMKSNLQICISTSSQPQLFNLQLQTPSRITSRALPIPNGNLNLQRVLSAPITQPRYDPAVTMTPHSSEAILDSECMPNFAVWNQEAKPSLPSPPLSPPPKPLRCKFCRQFLSQVDLPFYSNNKIFFSTIIHKHRLNVAIIVPTTNSGHADANHP